MKQHIYLLAFFSLLLPVFANAQISSNSSIGVDAAAHICVLSLMNGEEPDAVAKSKGLLPDSAYSNLKNPSFGKAHYIIKSDQVVLVTSTKPLCYVGITTLDPKEFATTINNYFSPSNHFAKVASGDQPDGSHLTKYTLDLGKRQITVLAMYSDVPRENNVQGLITVGLVTKGSK